MQHIRDMVYERDVRGLVRELRSDSVTYGDSEVESSYILKGFEDIFPDSGISRVDIKSMCHGRFLPHLLYSMSLASTMVMGPINKINSPDFGYLIAGFMTHINQTFSVTYSLHGHHTYEGDWEKLEVLLMGHKFGFKINRHSEADTWVRYYSSRFIPVSEAERITYKALEAKMPGFEHWNLLS